MKSNQQDSAGSSSKDNKKEKESFFTRLINRIQYLVNYFWTGVWKDPNDTTKVRVLKVINLSIRSFLDRDLQSRSMSLTYSTVLAIVPVFALLFAIGRGFGLQDLLEQQLYQSFPAQKQIISLSLRFVDSYLKEASQGLFVGIGILFLLWTLISLLSYIESAFNMIWDVKHDRTLYQKVTDYIAICLMVPILMICSSGVSIFMSATVQDNIHFAFLTPLINIVLEASPLVLAWLAFSLSFFLIPNTKVNFKYAAVAGAICAIVFQILQMLFVNGQIYVSKYNAIYGSFAFLPLLLIWLQLSWLILLFGCVLTYSLQNVYAFNFLGDVSKMSDTYKRKVTIILTAAIVGRFRAGKTPMTRSKLSFCYDVPIRVVSRICEQLYKAGLINYVMLPEDKVGIAPAIETGNLTVAELLRRLDNVGPSNFIPRFSIIYGNILTKIDEWLQQTYKSLDSILVADINIPVDTEKEQASESDSQPFLAPDVDEPSSPVVNDE
ncbi:MAG: YihY/virulence factor BrkB family protein [Muribaculaceae bacterium]|nr:YihY/virulence factor BrkB family protein [Muribaculaceae bacterium]MDE6755374.1 YihY/virulence factor BrkB family protein [Muribaculaceae bacterium]